MCTRLKYDPPNLEGRSTVSGHKNHKNHGVASVIYAGHGDINGQEGIVGVAVHYGNKGRVHALTIMAPDGSEFEITNNADKVESGGRKSVNSTDLSASIADDTSKTAGRQAKKSSRARVIDRSNEELDNAKKRLNEALHEVMKQRKRAEYFKGQTNTTLQIWRVVQLIRKAFWIGAGIFILMQIKYGPLVGRRGFGSNSRQASAAVRLLL